ncbi:MAG TPA: hypothetical protein VJM51_01365, partial [Dehalococcoidia bacterium]|nr:hypothetical protein [Dehalococcoidia bacterium]
GQVSHVLNRGAFDFHSNLEAPHPYSSTWDTWPVMARPLFYYNGPGNAKIYSMGNPLIFWLSLPALAFVLWQGLRYFRARIDARTGDIALSGRILRDQAPLLFVVLTFLGFWLPWATQPRIMFLYHYLPSLSFAIIALAYVVHWLWRREDGWGRAVAVAMLLAVGAMFGYLYPHLAAVEVPGWLDSSYYWFRGTGLFNWQ